MVQEPASSCSMLPAWTSSFLRIDYTCLGVIDSEDANFVWTGGVPCVARGRDLARLLASACTLRGSYVLGGLVLDAMVAEGHLFGDDVVIDVSIQLNV